MRHHERTGGPAPDSPDTPPLLARAAHDIEAHPSARSEPDTDGLFSSLALLTPLPTHPILHYTLTLHPTPVDPTPPYLRYVTLCLYRNMWLIALYLLSTIGLGPRGQ